METLFYRSTGTQVRITIPMIIKQHQRDIEHHEYLLANKELPVNQHMGRVASIKKHIARCKVDLANHLDQHYINNTYIMRETA
jgi:hypothetical protein